MKTRRIKDIPEDNNIYYETEGILQILSFESVAQKLLFESWVKDNNGNLDDFWETYELYRKWDKSTNLGIN